MTSTADHKCNPQMISKDQRTIRYANLVEAWYSLEQYIGFEGRQAFIHYCGLHQV